MSLEEIKDMAPKADSETVEVAASALTALGADAVKHAKDYESDDEEFEIPQRFTKSGRKRAVPFPLKLMKVLSTKEFRDIITWMPSGKSFSIVKPKCFVSDILPDHFKSAKFSSFTRKLHRWGFMRHYRGEEAGAFYHKDFQKDRLDLVEKMTCHKTEPAKSTVARKTQTQTGMAQTSSRPAAPANVQRLVPRPVVPQTLPSQDLVAQLQQQKLAMPEIRQPPQLDAAERLNAAIELEVTRRLKERIQAAAVSRHALALMQQQITPPAPVRETPRGLPWNSGRVGNLQAQLLAMHQAKQQRNLDASCFTFGQYARMEQGLDELPPTNIQGAKTA